MSKTANFHILKMKPSIIAAKIPDASGDSKRSRLALALAMLGAALMSGCAGTQVKDTSHTFHTVVIDAGHGGHDSGTRSRWSGAEKDATLEVARQLDVKLRADGFRTVLTRSRDEFIELNQRARISNRQNNAIFVSIHFNDSPARAIHGTEVYYKSPASHDLARRILASVSAVPGASSRGIRLANFRVLKLNEFPAVLVECGYLSNPAEGRRCSVGSYREKLAGAIADAVQTQRFGPAKPAIAVAAR